MTFFLLSRVDVLQVLVAVPCMKYFVVHCNGDLFCDCDVVFSSDGVLWQRK